MQPKLTIFHSRPEGIHQDLTSSRNGLPCHGRNRILHQAKYVYAPIQPARAALTELDSTYTGEQRISGMTILQCRLVRHCVRTYKGDAQPCIINTGDKYLRIVSNVSNNYCHCHHVHRHSHPSDSVDIHFLHQRQHHAAKATYIQLHPAVWPRAPSQTKRPRHPSHQPTKSTTVGLRPTIPFSISINPIGPLPLPQPP